MATAVSSSGALTLADYHKRSPSLLEKAVIDSVWRTSNPWKDFRMKNPGYLFATEYERITNAGLGTVDWVNLGEKGALYTADTQFHGERAAMSRNLIEVDNAQLKMVPKPINDPLQIRVKAWSESLAFDLSDKFFNGTPSGNSKSIIGLRHRMINATQWKVRANCAIDAGGVDLSTGNITAANAATFFMYVDSALSKMGNTSGKNCVMYIDGDVLRNIQRVFKTATGLLTTTRDNFDYVVDKYRDMVIRDAGYKADGTTRNLSVTENSAGTATTGSTYTSAFIVDYSDGAFDTWMFGSLKPNDLGIDPTNGVMRRWAFEFGLGLHPSTDNCFTRIFDVKAS